MSDHRAQQRQVADGFKAQFGAAPATTSFAPGRVNLLGEHTDYNGGYVLPMALETLGVSVAVAATSKPGILEFHSITLDQTTTRHVSDGRSGEWSDYVLGCATAVAREHLRNGGLRLSVMTSLPIGAGLSSSAALEVACLRALNAKFGMEMSPKEIAVIAQKVENDFVGLPCGIMDQFAASVGEPGAALFLNSRTLEYASAPKLADHAFLVVDSGVSHRLTDTGYATRVAECKAARDALGIAHLSDLSLADLERIDGLQDPLDRRARHVVTDNQLAKDGFAALQAGDAALFGELMSKSHATARDNYEITVPETDALAAAAEAAGAIGARQTGGGWGGAIVALVPRGKVHSVRQSLTDQFPRTKVLAVT